MYSATNTLFSLLCGRISRRYGGYTEIDTLTVSNLHITSVSVTMLMRVLEATSVHPHINRDRIAEFAGAGKSTTDRALVSLQTLGLVGRDTDGRYVCTSDKVRRGSGEEVLRQILRQALIRYRPFEAVCEGLALGESLDTACKRASVLLEIDFQKDQDKFSTLVKWAKELRILEEQDEETKLALDGDFESQIDQNILSAEDLESEVKARLYVAGRLGRAAYNSIDEAERELLAQALLNYKIDPSLSVEKSGQVVEDFLRGIANQHGFSQEARKSNGAGQLASLLVSRNVIHNHQQKLVEAVGTLRNAKAHHKDKKTLSPWEITHISSFTAFIAAIAVIYSIHEFLTTRRQIL